MNPDEVRDDRAIALARRLEESPQDDRAWASLAEIASEIGRNNQSLELSLEAMKLAPSECRHHSRIAHLYFLQGAERLAHGNENQAEQAFQAASRFVGNAVQLGFRDPSTFVRTATELLNDQQYAAARRGFELAIIIDTGWSSAYSGLGVACRAEGDLDRAIECYHRAIELDEQSPDAFLNLGNVYRMQGRYEDSLKSYDRAIRVAPLCAEAHNLRALALDACQEYERAEKSYLNAVKLNPTSADFLNNLALHYNQRNQLTLADRFFRMALQFSPDHAAIHNNYAKSLADQEQLSKAAEHYRRVTEIIPDQPLLSLREATLWPTVFSDTEHSSLLVDNLIRNVARIATQVDNATVSDLVNFADKPPFGLQFLAGNIRSLKESYARIFEGKLEPRIELAERTGRPQVVMVASRNHEGIFLRSMRGVLDRLPLADYDLTVAVAEVAVDRARRDLSNDSIQIVGLPDGLPDALRTLYELQADVLYYWEIGTDVLNYFLPFYRLAPVQCTSWGVQVTSGIPNVDYYLSSELVEPVDADEHYSEKLMLADTLLTYQLRASSNLASDDSGRWRRHPAEHLYVTAQHAGKLHPDFDLLLGDILRQDPEGVFVTTLNPESVAGQVFIRRFKSSSADVVDRIRLVGRLEKSDYYSLLSAADVLLDPPHFGGVNSTYDALSLAKPVVTCPSGFHRGRYTAACLSKLEVDDGLAMSQAAYVRRAVELGTEADRRHEVSSKIRERSEQLFEDQRAVEAHEQMFQQLIGIAREQSS